MSDVQTAEFMTTAMVKQEQGHSAIEEATARALEAQERAHVAVRYQMAHLRPRDLDKVRICLLKDCQRPLFAEAARYVLKFGGTPPPEGWTIRFVEAALVHMGNIDTRTRVTMEDEHRRIVCIEVTDLEKNVTYPTEVVIRKTVERRQAEGREVVSSRLNKQGQTVYIVLATDEEITSKQNSAISKALRTNGLRLIPAHLRDECLEVVRETMRSADAKDPSIAQKRVFDGFAQIGVYPDQIKKYLGREVVPQDFDGLRKLYQGIRNGEFTWKEVVEEDESETAGDVIAKKAAKARKSEQKAEAIQADQTPEQMQAELTALFTTLSKSKAELAQQIYQSAQPLKDRLAAMERAVVEMAK